MIVAFLVFGQSSEMSVKKRMMKDCRRGLYTPTRRSPFKIGRRNISRVSKNKRRTI
jgi:hypothetical protein